MSKVPVHLLPASVQALVEVLVASGFSTSMPPPAMVGGSLVMTVSRALTS